MNRLKVRLGIFLLIFLPFAGILTINLLLSPYLFEGSAVVDKIWPAFLILVFIYSAFLLIYKIIPEKYSAFYVAAFVYIYILSMLLITHIGLYQAPNMMGNLENLLVLPGSFLLFALWAIGALTSLFLLFVHAGKKMTILFFCCTIVLSSGVITSKELHFRNKVKRFFGDNRKGEIIFISTYKADKEMYSFSLRDLKMEKLPIKQYAQYLDKSQSWPSRAFSPDSKYKVYEYSYDRDDLSKIYVEKVKTGERILLAQGEIPVWLK